MRKKVAALASRKGLKPYAARKLAISKGIIPNTPWPGGKGKGRITPVKNATAEKAAARSRATKPPKLTGKALALTRGKGRKIGLRRKSAAPNY